MASTNYIPVNTNQRLGADLRRAIDTLRSVRDQLVRLNDLMVAQVSGTDYSEIEMEFGVPTGEGQTVYNLVAGASSALAVSAITQALDWLG